MIQCCGIKSITQTYIFKTQARGIPVMYNWWWRTHTGCKLDSQAPRPKHPNIVLLMSNFFPFGSCQRSTSNSMQWNQALLSMSQWCIARPRRSRLCKHTLSKPIEDEARWPHQQFTVNWGGGGRVMLGEQLCSRNDFLVANEEGQAIKSGRAPCQCHYLALSGMINELK